MSVWFTSDLHLGHRFVAGLRGFGSVEDHDAHLAEQWASRVGKNDQVWVLGDLAVSSPTAALDLIRSLPGTKHLIAGNHDGCHPMHRDSHKWQPKYLTAFASVQAFARRRINGTEVLLSHFPYAKDRHEARYMQYRLRDEGAWLLHGHTHAADQRVEGREIHVGVDAWDFAPVPIHVVTELVTSPAWCLCGVVDDRGDGTCGNCGLRIMTDELSTSPAEVVTPPAAETCPRCTVRVEDVADHWSRHHVGPFPGISSSPAESDGGA